MKIIACYIRVSTPEENQAKQRREINRWLKSHRISPRTVRWYIDKSTGVARRPKFDALQADILDGNVRAVVVWRLDRLSGTVASNLRSRSAVEMFARLVSTFVSSVKASSATVDATISSTIETMVRS